MFKRGNNVIFTDSFNISYNLTYNKTYIVKSSFFLSSNQIILVVDDRNKFIWIKSSNFKIDIIEERKLKLQSLRIK